MKRALVMVGNMFYGFNNDEWDSFRGEGRPLLNIGFGISLLGYHVNIASSSWDIKKSKKTWNNIELSNVPLYDYYDIVLTYTSPPISTNFKFGKSICIVHEDKDILSVKKYEENTGAKVIYISHTDNEKTINKIKEIAKSKDVYYIPSLYPIPSINIGFVPYSYNPKLPELKVFLHYASWKQNTTITGDRFAYKERLIIDYLKDKGYKIKLSVLVKNEEMVKDQEIVENHLFKYNDIKFIYSEKTSYKNIIELIQSNDICITYGAPVFPGNSLNDIISLGKLVIYIGDGRIGKEWLWNFSNPLYKQEEMRDKYIIYMQEKNSKSIEKLDRIMSDPIGTYEKYSNALRDYDFNNWKNITCNVLSEIGVEKSMVEQKKEVIKNKKKKVAVFIINPIRSAFKNDQYDSFRTEGRIAMNVGFGLSLIGFEVNIIFNEWKIIRKKEVWNGVNLSNLPLYKHYDYVLTWDKSKLDTITFDTLVYMDDGLNYLDQIRQLKNNTESTVIYTCLSKKVVEYSHMQELPLEVNYLPGLYPIPSINVGFIPYKFEPINSELKIYIYCNLDKIGVEFINKQQLIIDFFKNKGYKTNLYIHTKSKEMLNDYILKGDIINYIYDENARYIDIMNVMKSSDICINIGVAHAGPGIIDVISLGKPLILIYYNRKIENVKTPNIYESIEYLLNLQENNEESIKKLEKFILNPKESYDKFKESYKDFDFNNWKEHAKKFFIANDTDKIDYKGETLMIGNTGINKFGDGISWENHVNEIMNDSSEETIIFYGKEQHSEKISMIKKYKSSGKLLDCGCHIGRWIETFRENGYDYTGVDQSHKALETAKKHKPNGKFVHSLLWNMSFNKEFDIVHTNAVLQHNLLKEQEKIIPKMNQALKHDGILVITESTVNKETKSQRTYEGWITLVERYGFKFMESWHKNELRLEDNYLFIKIEDVNDELDSSSNSFKSPDSFKLFLQPYIDCIKSTKDSGVDDLHCIYLKPTKDYREIYISSLYTNHIKNIFLTCGFELIEENPGQLIFKKLSILKIKNWEYIRHLHNLCDEYT